MNLRRDWTEANVFKEEIGERVYAFWALSLDETHVLAA
jgi:hypothetical protein